VREQIIAFFFGASGWVSAFTIASQIPQMIYDLLIGGMLSAALVPVFSDVAENQGRPALWALFSRVTSLIAMLLAAIVLLLELLAPQVARLMAPGFGSDLLAVLTTMIRITAPAVLFFGLSGVVTGLLYALSRFSYTALGATVFNLGIVLTVPLLSGRLDGYSLALGVLLGSLLQLLVMTPGLRGVHVRFRLDLAHPALRRILVLYLPIALGLVVSNLQILIDRRLASTTGESSIAWMRDATALIQLPHGLVAVAISLAVLPALSRLSAVGDREGFRRTLGLGLRMVLVLIVRLTGPGQTPGGPGL
jgi:putative peptidoglycan lipid II flippase